MYNAFHGHIEMAICNHMSAQDENATTDSAYGDAYYAS